MTAISLNSSQPRERLKATFSEIRHFNTLPAEVQAAIMTVAVPRHFDMGQVIYLEGEPAEFVYILERGWVKATRITREGREQGLLFLRPVDIFGDIAVFAETTYPGTTTALESVDVWVIPSPMILALAIILKLSELVLHYINLVEDLSLRSVEARLVYTLLRNAELCHGQLVVPRREWTTFDEMAVRLGTVRDVLSRALKALEVEGYIRVEKHAIVLLDPKSLAELTDR